MGGRPKKKPVGGGWGGGGVGPRHLVLGDLALGQSPSMNAKFRALGFPVSLSHTAENVR